MYEKILVPLDGSELSEVSLPYAEDLAGRLGSAVTLIYVSESLDDPNFHMRKFYLDKIAEAVRQGAAKHLQPSEKKKIKVNYDIIVGNPAEEIVKYADKNDVGLIVMSTHGRSGIGRWALGIVADKVVRVASQPVAIIRAKGARADIRERGVLKRMLIPLDGSQEGEAAVPCIADFIAKLKAEVVLLQVVATGYQTMTAEGYEYVVYTEQQMESDRSHAKDYLDKMAARLKQPGVTVKTEVKFGTAADEIISFADEIHADMVAMATHGRSGIGRWVLGSVADRVLRAGNTPVLLVRVPGACSVEL